MSQFRKFTNAEIEAGKTDKGGFKRNQLAKWGVHWPPRHGWRRALLEGNDPNNSAASTPRTHSKAPLDAAEEATVREVLRDVVSSVISHGMGHILSECDSYMAYVDRDSMPTIEQLLRAEEVFDYTLEGTATAEDRVYRFQCVRKVA